MVRVKWRDGQARRAHYGVLGQFGSDGVSLRKWTGAHVPMLKRFFALNQNRRMFEIVSDDPKVAPVVLPEVPPDADVVAVPDEFVSEFTANDSAAESPVYDLLLGPLSEPVPLPDEAVVPVEVPDDADGEDERPRRRGRPKKFRS